MIVSLLESNFGKEDILNLLQKTGDLLPEPLSQRVDLTTFLAKIQKQAKIWVAVENAQPVGIIAYYANDLISRTAHLTFMGLLTNFQNRKIGTRLLEKMIEDCQQANFRRITLEVHPSNTRAIHLYGKHGFQPEKIHAGKIFMSLPLYSSLQISKLEQHPCSSLLPGIDLRIKRDDLYPFCGGGSKARKIGPIIRSAIHGGFDTIVTNGALQSNHARAAALACAEANLHCHLVLHTEEPAPTIMEGNLLLMHLAGAEIEYCQNSELAACMDAAMEKYQLRGKNPLYVWGGGHCIEGSMAFYDAAAEAQEQCADWIPDFVVHASGTGTTQAGLIAGYAHLPTRIIGISVARTPERGSEVIRQALQELGEYAHRDFSAAAIDFRDNWLEGGYGKTSTRLHETISEAARLGLVLDPTYTGKAFLGLRELHRTGLVPAGSRVLFWHTGGLLNLLSSNEIQRKD